MNQPVYNTIGKNYNQNRRADPYILNRIIELLDLPAGSNIADIGAGTGNYANALGDLSYRIIAIEPSDVMLQQGKTHKNVTWLKGAAESIPLQENSVNGIIAILCIHHFTSLKEASKEFDRICPAGPVVVLTYDPRKGQDFWFNRYFPAIYKSELEKFPPVKEAAAILTSNDREAQLIDFPLPRDLIDKNMHSGWNRPEIYFNAQMRANTSGFAQADQSRVEQGLALLKNDLDTGLWDEKYGYLRKQAELHTGFVFIKLTTK